MSRISVHFGLIASLPGNVVSPQFRRAGLLGALLLAASLPAGSLAAVYGPSGGSGGPVPPVRSGPGSAEAPNAGTGGGQLLFRPTRRLVKG